MAETSGELGSLLIEEGLLSLDQLYEATDAAEEAGQPLARYLVEHSVVPEQALVATLARSIGYEFVDLTEVAIDPNAVALVPEPLARRYGAIPFAFQGDLLLVALADPANVLALDDIRALTGREVVIRVATRSDIDGALRRVRSFDEQVTEFTSGDDELEEEDLHAVEAASEDAPIVKLVNMLISKAVGDRASDIHIEPTDREVRIRYRIDGVLHEVMRTPKNTHAATISRLKIMSDIDIAERRKPQDGRISVRLPGTKVDLRVSTLPTIYGEKVVMRILDTSTALLNLSDLGFEEDTRAKYEEAFRKPYGTILVTGPTGSGKSTTLYATLNVLNQPDRNIITIEDPVEYRLAGINQVQVNRRAGLTFASALRSFLRQDPDIMLVGEIRDLETANIAIESALTGHMVLSTLHTNTAAAAIARLTEMGVEPFLISSALDAVLAQRLARRLCEKCKEPYDPTPESLIDVGWSEPELEENGVPKLYRAIGCSSCSGTGYRGRLAVHELMVVSEEIERMTVERATGDDISRKAEAQGMRTLRSDGLKKVERGLSSVEEILRVTV
ncbi:MAG: Flp pilus assembly complex ATPase component TadA [Acidimicrobiia bacterium]|nr:MAG: Flp pilus assembly complex ATPase component TadA [Acidimicrobiia bacterium]